MSKVLFVIPYSVIGGISTSLSSLINSLQKVPNLDISVFSMQHFTGCNIAYSDVLLPENRLLSSFFGEYSNEPFYRKILFFFPKIVRRVSHHLGIPLDDWLLKMSAKNIEKKNKYDVIVAYAEGSATRLVSFFSNKNKVAWIHCDYSLKENLNISYETLLYSKYSKIVCVSNYTAVEFAKLLPKVSHKVCSIGNVLDEDRILTLSQSSIDDVDFNHSTDTFVLVSMGRMHRVKRFEKIPEIALILKNKGLRFKWYLLGPSDDITVCKQFNESLLTTKTNDVVFWLGKKSNPYPYLAKSDLLVSLSSTEACPMIFNEAKILGIPIVTTNFGSSSEFINQGIDGYITSLDDMPQLLVNLITNKIHYRKLRQGMRYDRGTNDRIIHSVLKLLNNSSYNENFAYF